MLLVIQLTKNNYNCIKVKSRFKIGYSYQWGIKTYEGRNLMDEKKKTLIMVDVQVLTEFI
jgi:hypothetical protein